MLLDTVEDTLRGRPRRTPALLLQLLLSGGVYGAVLGTYGGVGVQACYAAIKVPLMLLATSLLCLPTFVGWRGGWRATDRTPLQEVLAHQVAMAWVLAALAPVIGLCYLSGISYPWAILVNAAAFVVASLLTTSPLGGHSAPSRPATPRSLRAAWWAMHTFVGIQAAWMLRPFVGSPGLEPQFLRASQWGNAYVALFEAVWTGVGGTPTR